MRLGGPRLATESVTCSDPSSAQEYSGDVRSALPLPLPEAAQISYIFYAARSSADRTLASIISLAAAQYRGVYNIVVQG
jgi:hypothetical protein